MNDMTKTIGALALATAAALPAQADTRVVEFNVLNATALLPTPFGAGDVLLLDTTVTQETGALSQSVTFSVGAGVTGLIGRAVWEISTAADPGPRLVGVNIDIRDAANAVVVSDTFLGTLGGFAISNFASGLAAGTYSLVVTGNAIRDAVLDVSVSLVPEPRTYGLMLAGLGVIALLARRRIG